MFRSLLLFKAALGIEHGAVYVYKDQNFKGEKYNIVPDQTMVLATKGFDNQISSFQIGAGVKVKFCKATPCNDKDHFSYTEIFGPHEAAMMPVYDNIVLEATVETHGGGRVALFTEGNCLMGQTSIFPVGKYLAHDLFMNGVTLQQTQGIWVEEGIQATVYTDPIYSMNPTVFRGPIQICDLALNYSNVTISSMVIEPFTQSEGIWVPAAYSNTDISASLSRTVSLSNLKTVTHEVSETITKSIDEDFFFFSERVTKSKTHTTKTSVTSITEHTTTSTCEATCENVDQEPATLYQWQAQTSNIDGEGNFALVNTCFYVCRYGNDTQSPPQCPAGACKDSACNTCFPWKASEESLVDIQARSQAEKQEKKPKSLMSKLRDSALKFLF